MSDHEARSDRSLRAVTLYKTVKGLVGLGASGALGLSLLLGYGPAWHHLAALLRDHAVSGGSARLADLLVAGSTPHGLHLTCVALGFDGAMTSGEAWALRRGRWWGPWLVVAATGLLVPFEALELAHHVSAGRLLVLAANVIVVAVLVRHARRDGRKES